MSKLRDVIGYVPIYASAAGMFVTQAFVSCSRCGCVISSTGGPSRDAICPQCVRAALAAEPTQEPMIDELIAWQQEGERLLGGKQTGVLFALGAWWADRPWRKRHPAPPQTPMTDEQAVALWLAAIPGKHEDFGERVIRAVERHHGIGPARGAGEATRDEVKLWRDRYSSLYMQSFVSRFISSDTREVFDRWQREVDAAYKDAIGPARGE